MLSTVPRLHRSWNRGRLVGNVSSQSRCHGAVDDVAGDCGVESGREVCQRFLYAILQGLLVEDVDGWSSEQDVGCAS
jgi:hypothetical protein